MEKVRYFRHKIRDGKTILNISPSPQSVFDGEKWVDLIESKNRLSLKEEGGHVEYPRYTRLAEQVIFDGEVDVEQVDVIGRTPRIKQAERAAGLQYERELVWVDGAEDISGVIVLPHDDYDKVYVLTGDKDNPEIEFIPRHGLKPNYKLAKFQRWFERRFGYVPTKQDIIDYNASIVDKPKYGPFGEDVLTLFDEDEAYRQALVRSLKEEPPPRPYYTQPGDGKTYIYVDGFSGGAGTQSDPYIIEDIDELQDIWYKSSAHYALGNDIDASETRDWEWEAAIGSKRADVLGFMGLYEFSGSLDGRGHVIKNLYSNMSGLIAYINYDGVVIKNIGLVDVELDDSVFTTDVVAFEQFGAFANYLRGPSMGTSDLIIVENCFVTGIIRSYQNNREVAGFCSAPRFGATIRNCYAQVEIDIYTTSNPICGFFYWEQAASDQWPLLAVNSYCVTPMNNIANNTIRGFGPKSRSDDTLSSCYWDNTVLPITVDTDYEVGVAKTTVAMKQQSTYTNWDFNNTWAIDASINNGYPYLRVFADYFVTIKTEQAINITATSAKLQGSTPSDDVEVFFQYRPVGTSTWLETEVEYMAIGGNFSATVSNLSPWTEYEFRAVQVDSEEEEAFGEILTFKTSAVLASVTTKAVTGVTIYGG